MESSTVAWRRHTVMSLVAVLLLTACWGGDDDTEPSPTTPGQAPIVSVVGANATSVAVLGLRLSEGAPAYRADDAPAVVTGTPLGQAEIDAILDRLPAWVVPDDDRADFNRPATTLLPPLVGDTIATPFPPDATSDRPTGSSGPLEVLRFQPEGDVELAPFVSITFDQPMVPLATLDQLDAAEVPVQVTPELSGRWRWIGTRTLRFEPSPGPLDRLPAATEYEIVVPAGTRSATGGRLAADVRWTFTTPPPTVTQFAGESDSLPLAPVFVAVFDQRVRPDAILSVTSITADGRPWPVRLATDAELNADQAARSVVDAALDGRAVAFRPVGDLPPDAAVEVRIGPNTPSAEGPLTSPATATYRARTFGALTVAETSCGWGDGCHPGSPLTIRFSNPLDPVAFSGDQVTVSPRIPGLRIDVSGSVIQLSGATAGRATYTVGLAAGLRDVFGQTLGTDTTVEFRVGSARPELRGFDRQWITTDPAADTATVSVSSINHPSIHVQAWAVDPGDLAEFRRFLDQQYSDVAPPLPEWPLVFDEVIDTGAATDRWTETAIDLSAPFTQTESQLVVRVEPTTSFSPSSDDYWRNRPTIAWVQRTTLGVDAFVDQGQLLIWTTDLVTGEPVGRVPVELLGDRRIATTNDEGVARVDLGTTGITGLYADAGDRAALLASDWWEGWTARPRTDEGRWYVFDDRGVYRPGETVRITGWVRRLAWSQDAQLALFGGDGRVSYRAYDAQGVELASGTAALNALGGFNLRVPTPAGANLGQAYVELQLVAAAPPVDAASYHSFQIQEYRTPEFEVTARPESVGPYFTDRPATVAVDAEYYSGGPLPGAEVDWLVSTRDATYTPPNWDRYTFGVWQPWWWFDSPAGAPMAEFDVDCFDCPPGGDTEYQQYTGSTDGTGSHYLQIDFDGPDVDLPTSVVAEATVFDVNRQAWSSRTDLLVHPARYYVGLRSDRTFVEQGTPIRIDTVVTDVDGTIVPGRRFDVTVARVEWGTVAGEWTEQLVDPSTCSLTSTSDATDGSMRCEVDTEVGGTYRVTAIVTDDGGHRNRSELTVWVAGGEARPTRTVDLDTVTIVPDHDTYEAGGTARLLVQAPFAPASGLATVTRGGIVSTQSFEAAEGSAVIEIPIDDDYVPGVTVQVDMVGSAVRTADDGTPRPDLPRRTAYATGRIELAVPPLRRTLDVTATPAASAVRPGDDTSVTVVVRGPDGEPVSGADVAVVVVDEAVLALTGYELADPLEVFYQPIWSELTAQYFRAGVVQARTDLVAAGDEGAAPTMAPGSADFATAEDSAGTEAPPAEWSADRSAGDGAAAPIELRTDFDALAVYAPAETTDASGSVTVAVTLPDNLTRYRVMAVAVDGADRFGKGESTITARLPLQIRPSAPRFANFGDRFELPVVVQNQTDAPLEVDVVVQAANLTPSTVSGSAATGKRVTVPANDRVEVRFPMVADQVGTARLRVVAVAGAEADAAEVELPVYTPATAEAFATYGVIDDGAVAQPLLAPTGVFPQFGGLEIGTSSTALQALTDAVLYLVDYRYDSADGYASRIMAVATLRDVLAAFAADGLPAAAELDARVGDDITRLAALQNDDGGFPYWQRGQRSIPWQSIQATHALVLADRAGYPVPADTLARALEHLADIERHYPSDYHQDVRDSLSAYALYVRAEAGQRHVAKATELYRRAGDDLQLDAVAWLWPSINDDELRTEIERRFLNGAVDTPSGATFATSYGEDAYVIANSDRKTDGVILDALITEAPGSDLIPKVVAGLLGNQIRGRWNNAHENAFILIALHRYFETFESVTPDFVARVWLGDLYAAEQAFAGRSTDRAATVVPMTELLRAGDSELIVQKDGDGRLYYRLGLRYAPSDLRLDARDEGFVVDRVYEAIDRPDDVIRNADGTWSIKAGAKVRVRVTMVADARRTNIALIDPLPAGLEPVNPAFAVSQSTPPEGSDGGRHPWYWGWNWFEHQNLRDDRAEVFTSYLPAGTYEYTYVARATTPGEFVVPPARAEEVYAPEVFGRSAATVVVIG